MTGKAVTRCIAFCIYPEVNTNAENIYIVRVEVFRPLPTEFGLLVMISSRRFEKGKADDRALSALPLVVTE